MCLNTSKGTSCLRRSKLTFCYFIFGCSFISILVQKFLKSDIAFLRYGSFIEDVITGWCMVESWFWDKGSLKFRNLFKVLVFWQFRDQFWHENTVFAPNPSSNFRNKYWRFQSMWNLKIDFGTIYWGILTLHPRNSKSSLLTTGTFRYVVSHIISLSRIMCCRLIATVNFMPHEYIDEVAIRAKLTSHKFPNVQYCIYSYIQLYTVQKPPCIHVSQNHIMLATLKQLTCMTSDFLSLPIQSSRSTTHKNKKMITGWGSSVVFL